MRFHSFNHIFLIFWCQQAAIVAEIGAGSIFGTQKLNFFIKLDGEVHIISISQNLVKLSNEVRSFFHHLLSKKGNYLS